MFVTIQFVTAGYLVIITDWETLPLTGLLIVIVSGLLGFWSIGIMKFNNLRIVPTPLETARLRMNGPYRMIRHPMYSSLMLLSIPLMIHNAEPVRIIMGLLLGLDLILKLHYEERLLKLKFPEYEAYMRKTKRIIPFIY